MHIFRSCEFDNASDPKVRPPANRARTYDRPTMNLELARVNAARHRKPTAGELVDPPAPCRTTARQLRAADVLQLRADFSARGRGSDAAPTLRACSGTSTVPERPTAGQRCAAQLTPNRPKLPSRAPDAAILRYTPKPADYSKLASTDF